MSASILLSGRVTKPASTVNSLLKGVGQLAAARSTNDAKIGQLAIATEAMSQNDQETLTSVYNNIEATLKSIAGDLGIAAEGFQLTAAAVSGVFGTSPREALSAKLRSPGSDVAVIQSQIPGASLTREMSLEAYDERDNRQAQQFSIVYNMIASRQDDFGELFFPTLVINPTEMGITVALKMLYVFNDFKRSTNGALANFGRKNLIRAYVDATILRNEQTRVVPVLRSGGGADDNTAIFATDVPAWTENLGSDINVTTGALKVDSRIDLIGVSQTNELLNSGIMGASDTLDTFIVLDSVYVKLTDGTDTDIIRISTENLLGSNFTYAPQGNYRKMMLAMETDGVVLSDKTLTIAGTAPKLLPELANHGLRVMLTVNGSVSLDKGDCNIQRGALSLTAVRNAAGQLITGTAFTSLAGRVASMEMVGYTLKAWRANSNIRQRAQLIDSQVEYRAIAIPYLSPISAIMPVIGASEDKSPVEDLLTAVGVRISNDAVTGVLKVINDLAGYKAVADSNGELPAMAAIGHVHVKPTFFRDDIQLPSTVNSLKSHELLKDIRASIVEKLRFYANEAFRQSEYKAAAMVLTGNVGFKPTVIIGTDQVLYNYLTADGDLRTLGETFDVRLACTLDERFKGKIVMSFGVFGADRNTAIHPLNFGNMLYSPELTVVLPVSRDGQTSKELIVTPRYLHWNSLPVAVELNVSGLAEATDKIAVNMHTV